MRQAVPSAIAVANVLDRVMRADRGRLLANLAAGLRDLSLAEEVLQDASISALSHWGRTGVPNSPQAWLLTVSRRKALDRFRGSKNDRKKADDLALLIAREEEEQDEIPDERLRLIFACCHPALELKSRVALTLRTVCGLTTTEIARAFLDQEATMGQRLSRAKAKIAAAGIAFEVPAAENWPARLDAVLTTVYLIFTTGYVASGAEPRDLCLEAEYLMRLIERLNPDDPEIEGALAMMMLTAARRNARVASNGSSLPPSQQDRAQWDSARIEEGRALLSRAMARQKPGPFQIKAAIADCQMADSGPDWPQIAALYGALWQFEPTPVVTLNAAVAVAEAGDVQRGLNLIEGLAQQLSEFQPWHAARAALLSKSGNPAAAARAYERAIDMAPGAAEKLFLEARLAEIGAGSAAKSTRPIDISH
jgi:RNA polymerase sigma factor (sigma-70 family)